MINNIITGEKIQQICNLYIGKQEDFNYNPVIKNQTNKHLNINSLNNEVDNPYYIFCYPHLINELSFKINYFKNKFILITHNSDQNIGPFDSVKIILNCNNLVKWYAQNLLFNHDKLHLLPIGLANSMWPHGNLTPFSDTNLINNLSNKSKFIYFNFNINTNVEKRRPCYEILKNRLTWLDNVNPVLNLYRLKEYKFCICPEGNGVDTHRLWECLYLKVVPIVINTSFTQILTKYNIPLVILNDWNDIFSINLIYENYTFNDEIFINLSDFNKLISQINT
jgi:hypothetical protein